MKEASASFVFVMTIMTNFLNIQNNKAFNLLKFLVIALFIASVSFSPSLKVIPSLLITTSFHDNQRLVELLLLIFVYVFYIRQRKSVYLDPNLVKLICITATFAIASSLISASPRHGLIEITIFIGLCYLAIIVADAYNENSELILRCLIYIFFGSIILVMVSFYTGYITATISNTPVRWPNPLTGFSSIRSFNQYQLWTFGLISLPVIVWELKSRTKLIFTHIALIAWFVLLFFSASRGALLAWIIGLSITAIVYKKIAWPFIRIQLIHIFLGFLSYKILFELIPSLKGSAVVTGEVLRDTTYDRIELWSLALKLVKENPVFGVGPMHFAWYSEISAHPHNSLIQLMCEWGLPATILIIVIATYCMYYWFKKFDIECLETKNSTDKNTAIVLFFTIVTCAIYSLVDGVIVMPVSQVMMFTIIGIMIGYSKVDSNIYSNSINLKTPIFVGVVLTVLVWSILPEVLQGISGNAKHFSVGYKAAGPRLWTEIKP